ncbi:MAG: hypothetical protein ACYCZZ_01175 [Minisyncoccota bacterium]
MKGCGRAGSTGKKAEIIQEGQETVVLRGSSFKDLCRKIRDQFGIPSHIMISSGVTHL